MRVVRNTGSTADVVGLGEDLQLRIEIDQDSAFGLFARTLEARSPFLHPSVRHNIFLSV